MAQKIRIIDIVGISFLIYSIYFGAGNLIFPIKVGYRVGTEMLPAMVGFILAAVVLPAIVLWSCCRVDGGLGKIVDPLPRAIGLTIAVSLFLIIGPFVALPRFSGVAYNTIQPLIGSEGGGASGRFVFSLLFFSATLVLALRPGKILDIVGKVMSPVLVLVLLFIAGGSILFPQGPVAEPDIAFFAKSNTEFFVFGFEEGYQTLNALASLILGLVILNAVRGLGLEGREVERYTMLSMLFAGLGLALTFAALSYLGATSHELVDVPPHLATGAEMAPYYARALYGPVGEIALAIIVTLACLTTAIGLIAACSQYFHQLRPSVSYVGWAITFTLISILCANVGLGPLLLAAKPVLLGVYPMAMSLSLLSLVRAKLWNTRVVYLITLIPVFPLSALEGLRAAELQFAQQAHETLLWLPLQAEGFGWLLPGCIFFFLAVMIGSFTDRRRWVVQE